MSAVALRDGLARLSRGTYFREASLDLTLSLLTESAGQMSGIERCGIWALTGDRRELRCLELYELSSGRHSSGGSVTDERYPAYFQALASEEAIVADDPGQHPGTAELAMDYLPAHGITAVLDTPIHIRGELQGVFSLEQVGAPRPWTTLHRLFAHGVANLVTLALVEHEAAEARRQAQSASERLRAVFDGSRDALLMADAGTGVILDANHQAERLFGCSRIELVGKHPCEMHAGYPDEGCLRDLQALLSEQGRGAVLTSVRRRDGSPVLVEVWAELAQIEGRSVAVGVFRPV